MLSTARQHLGERFRNVTLVAADLEKLPFFDCFDVIFSTAAFHWIRNQSQLYRSLRDALCSGGWLIAQCGGGPNLAHFRERVREVMAEQPYRQHLGHFQEPWAFESAESAAELLREAGFSQIETSIESAPTTLANADVFAEFVSNVILRPHLEALPNQQLKNDLVRDLTDLASHDDPPFSLDYWRLNLQGRA
jgi:trans-aconitate 2-methyltransferase